MQTSTTSTYFQTQMRLETDRVLNGSQTPFKDTLVHAFETTANIFAITANATAVGRIQSRSWLLGSCHEANMEAIKHDNSANLSALQMKLEAIELQRALDAHNAGATA